MASARVSILVLLSLSVVTCGCAVVDNGEKQPFEKYVLSFRPNSSPTAVVPEVAILPDEVYLSSREMAAKNPTRFREMVCLYLLKYHAFYLANMHQSYDLVEPNEVSQIVPGSEKNGKYYMLNQFVLFANFKVPSHDDCVPSNAAEWYCRHHFQSTPEIQVVLKDIDRSNSLINEGAFWKK